MAATIDELALADDPARWRALGFAFGAEGGQLGAVRVRFCDPARGHGLVGWSLRDLLGEELDGLATARSQSAVPPAAATHPNGVVAIDHIVAVSPAFARTVAALQAAGLDLRRVREEPTPAGAPRQAFFRLGREILELVEEPEYVTERAGGRDRPAHFWGLALLVEDLDQSAAVFGEHVGSIRPAVQAGRMIATVKRSAGLSLPLALMSAAREGVRG